MFRQYKGVTVTLLDNGWRATIAGKQYGINVAPDIAGNIDLLWSNAIETINKILRGLSTHDRSKIQRAQSKG